MKRASEIFRQVFPVIVAVLSVMLTFLVFHFQIYTLRILSNSMQPTLNPGDIVIVREIPTENVTAGMVIVGVRPRTHDAYLHRVISSVWDGKEWLVQTRGDANPEPDEWTLLLKKPTVPLLMARVPLGIVGQKLPVARSTFGWLAALLITINVLYEVNRRRSERAQPRGAIRPSH